MADPHDKTPTSPKKASFASAPTTLAGVQVPVYMGEKGPEPEPWSVAQTLSGKRILLTGSTGFLAKVMASMLLRYHPDLEQLYLVIRDRKNATAQQRFIEEIELGGTFDPLRAIYGEGLREFLDQKVSVLSGDITMRYLGLEEEEARALSSTLDMLINSAGLTNFNPNLQHALEINTLSERHILEFLKLGGFHASLLHVSTCFVAGNTTTPTPEILPTPEIYPAREELGVDFDVNREIDDCLRMIAHAHELTEDQENSSNFHKLALDRLKSRNLSPSNTAAYKAAYAKVRDLWIKDHLSYRGRDRAAHWGWPNIYTYTKSMGERLLVEHKDELNFAIVRPAIVESALAYPSRGWNEGVNTSAPLIYLRYKGHQYYPMRPDGSLDMIPVDFVCGAMIGIAAGLLRKRADHVYHLGSSDKNPLRMERLIELTTLGTRKLRTREVNTPAWQKIVMNAIDGQVVDQATFRSRSAPGISRAVRGVRSLLKKAPTRSLGGVGKVLGAVEKNLHGVEKATDTMGKMFEIFMPFIYVNKFTFLARNIDHLCAQFVEPERTLYGSPIADLDWYDYMVNVHIPGLNKHVFPQLEEKLKASSAPQEKYADLVDLFDASTHNFATRLAMQHHHHGITERYTYGQLRQAADRGASLLGAWGVGEGQTVMLVSENRPQWGMAYFAILKANAIAVPLDPEASAQKIAKLAKSCRARLLVLSPRQHERLANDLEEELQAQGHQATLVHFGQLLSLQLTHDDAAAAPTLPQQGSPALKQSEVASLIYTSGTTGTPKGVMLTHKNFSHLLHGMHQIFPKIDSRDGFLSVLPLHHTFEFSCGLLMPLSRGSSVTYLEELTGDELTAALGSTRITALIGVPALWQLLDKRIDQRLRDLPQSVRWVIKQLMFLNRTARERVGVNLGPALFGAIHRAFGGKIRYFISGGAALPVDLLKSFHAMGFDMYEGYGLTEAAPVLTVNRPDKGLMPGSVGRALPGIDVEIHEPNDQGIGEVKARGDSVMLGYLDMEEETQQTLREGWLFTGDLGHIDAKGNLTIVGRAKEVIVTSGGKNVYPDELEEVYGTHKDIAEISVVGLPDGRGSERVAALVHMEKDADQAPQELAKRRALLREWLRVEGQRVAAHERLQVVRFWEDPLPRTATRKIKRREVVEILERLMEAEAKEVTIDEAQEAKWRWLDRILGTLCDWDEDQIHAGSRFGEDLGFDSLMVVELSSVLEAKGYPVSADRLTAIQTVQELRELLEHANDHALVPLPPGGTLERVEAYDLPQSVAKLGRSLLFEAQIKSYSNFFDVEVYGRANIPHHDPNVIVAANHSSHLDMGLVKYALGDFGQNIRALAAADYFFKNKLRKTYFTNFTNLLPLERSGNLEGSLKHAKTALKAGEMVLIFPEGTRSRDGKMQPFRKGMGYLVATEKVNVLPIYIEGTHRAFAKGQKLPSLTSRNLKVFIGKPLSAFDLLEAADLAATESDKYQVISDAVHQAIAALRDRDKGRHNKHTVDLEQLFFSLEGKFEREQLDSAVSYYFSLGNVDDQKWTVLVDADQCAIRQGKPPAADCVIKTTPEIFRKIVQESYVPSFDEFMNGTIKTNAPELLMRFQSVFQL